MADVNERPEGSLKRKHDLDQGDSSPEATVFPCKICSATFVTQISLTRHNILHEDDQQDDRNLIETSSDDIQIPVPKVAMQTGEIDESNPGPAKVPKLQKTLKPIPNLKPIPPLIPKREFELAQAAQMMQMKTHRCEMCSVYFGKKEDLARHITRTHGGARFICPYCSRNISRRDHLKRHIKNVHPEICTDTEIGPFLADPNASRAAKEQHAENFIAQYGSPEVVVSKPLMQLQVQNQTPTLSQLANSLLENTSPQLQPFNDDDLYEEGDEEFEGEEDTTTEGLMMSDTQQEQITIEPELPGLPLLDDYEDQPEQQLYDNDEEDSSGYLDHDQPQELFDNQHLIVQNPALQQSDNEGSTMGSPVKSVVAPERKFKCEMCEAAFMSKINLQRHESTHSIIRPHKCSICGKGFLRKEHLTKHLSSVHSGMKFTCQFCSKDISRKDHLLRHIRNCHPQEYQLMPPELIQSEMSQPIPRQVENGIQSSPKQAFITCDICPETFNHIDELHEHQSSVHSDVRKYKCPNCPKAFKRKEHLVKHEVLHTGEKKFGCSICKKVYPRKDAVLDHIRRVHNQQQQTPAPVANYPCNLCEFAVFQQPEQLQQHLKTYHGVSNNNDGIGAFGLLNGTVQSNNVVRNNLPNPKKLPQPKFNSNRSEAKLKQKINRGLGSLMGLINKGSLSLSRVTTNDFQ